MIMLRAFGSVAPHTKCN